MPITRQLFDSDRQRRRLATVHRVYVHFLDFYTVDRSRRDGVSERAILAESRRAFRLAVLFAEQLVVPASSFFESPVARRICREHSALVDAGVVYLAAAEDTLADHRAAKTDQYDSASPVQIREGYRSVRLSSAPPYLRRGGSSVAAIQADWLSLLDRDQLAATLDPSGELGLHPHIEKRWARVPDDLGGRAFVTAHVTKLLAPHLDPVPEKRIATVIEDAYIRSYATILDAHLVGGFIRLRARAGHLGVSEAFSLGRVQQNLVALGLQTMLDTAPVELLLRIRAMPEWDRLKRWLDRPHARITEHEDRLARIMKRLLAAAAAHDRATSIDLHLTRSRGMSSDEPSVAIVTALPVERVAVEQMLEARRMQTVPGDPAVYTSGEVPAHHANGGKHRVVLTQLARMGTNSAAAATSALARSFPSVRDVLMVGIACAVPNVGDAATHVRLGDVVVSDRRGVIQFDHITVTPLGSQLRDLTQPPSARMTGALNRLQTRELSEDFPWDARLDELIAALPAFRRPVEPDVLLDADGRRVGHPRDPQRRRGRPRIFRGLIGSSNGLFRDTRHRDVIRDVHGVRAVEMEASGVAESAWHHGLQYLVVRGTCDYGDAVKSDRWQKHAAAVAAAYARCVIEELND